MIKPTAEVPKKRTNQRAECYEDMMNALKSGIFTFEFDGEGYNYKTLATVAREEAAIVLRTVLRNKVLDYNRNSAKANKLPPVDAYYQTKSRSWWRYYARLCFVIINCPGESRRHVYCEIKPDRIEALWDEVFEKLQEMI